MEIFDATCRFACCRFSLGSQRLASGSATTRGCKGSHELQMVKWNRYQIDCIKWTWWTFFIELREKSIIWNCQEVLVFTSKSDVFRVASNPMWNLKVATEDWKAFPWMTSCPRPPRVGIYGGAYEAVRQPISELRQWGQWYTSSLQLEKGLVAFWASQAVVHSFVGGLQRLSGCSTTEGEKAFGHHLFVGASCCGMRGRPLALLMIGMWNSQIMHLQSEPQSRILVRHHTWILGWLKVNSKVA